MMPSRSEGLKEVTSPPAAQTKKDDAVAAAAYASARRLKQ